MDKPKPLALSVGSYRLCREFQRLVGERRVAPQHRLGLPPAQVLDDLPRETRVPSTQRSSAGCRRPVRTSTSSTVGQSRNWDPICFLSCSAFISLPPTGVTPGAVEPPSPPRNRVCVCQWGDALRDFRGLSRVLRQRTSYTHFPLIYLPYRRGGSNGICHLVGQYLRFPLKGTAFRT